MPGKTKPKDYGRTARDPETDFGVARNGVFPIWLADFRAGS